MLVFVFCNTTVIILDSYLLFIKYIVISNRNIRLFLYSNKIVIILLKRSNIKSIRIKNSFYISSVNIEKILIEIK